MLSLLHVPPSHKKIYITLSLVHLIYTVGDNCMRQNACYGCCTLFQHSISKELDRLNSDLTCGCNQS